MKLKYLLGGSLLALVLVTISTVAVNAFSIRDLLGLGDDEDTAATEETGSTKSKVSKTQQDTNWGKQQGVNQKSLGINDIQQIIANLDSAQRAALLADEKKFQEFVRQEARNLSVLAAAFENKVDQDTNTAFLMRRGAQNILRETYLNRLINSKIPAEFPTGEQVSEYYEQNKSQFVLEERVHVWQIFFSTQDKSESEQATIKQKATTVARQVSSGKLAFDSAVQSYSDHEQSRTNGGYMGLLKVSDLKPGLREPIMKLKPGDMSGLINSDTGLHIFRRGNSVARQDVELDQVRGQVRNLLRQQAAAQLRTAVYQQAEKSYPQELKDAKIEEWRLRIRTNMPPSSGAAAGK